MQENKQVSNVNIKQKQNVVFVAGVFAAAILALLLVVVSFKGKLIPISNLRISPTEPPKIEPAMIIVAREKNKTAAGSIIEIFLSPKKTIDLSAFQFRGMLSQNVPESNLSITINPELKNQAWYFPIVRAGESEIKISGYRRGNSPYVIEKDLLLATVEIKTDQDIALRVDTVDTIFYAFGAVTKIPYEQSEN